MSSMVWKYDIAVNGLVNEIAMPDYSQIICVDTQRAGLVTMWAVVDKDKPMVSRKFVIYGTGHPIQEEQVFHIGHCYRWAICLASL